MNEIAERLVLLFERHRVMDIETVRRNLQGRSRRSVFRDLHRVGYCTSYSHAGKFHTLKSIPEFDSEGLWKHGNVCFSRYGTLRNTTAEMIKRSEEGRTHGELEGRLGLRLHNTLLDLVRSGEIGRGKTGRLYVYLSADPERANVQLQRRRSMDAFASRRLPPLSTRIEVFAEIIRTGALPIDSASIASGLARRGIVAAVGQIERMMKHYDIKKNGL